jgi:hypothetical protein
MIVQLLSLWLISGGRISQAFLAGAVGSVLAMSFLCLPQGVELPKSYCV